MAGRYDRVNGVFSKVQKRYDKVNGVWTPTKKRYDKTGGVWTPSYTGAICSSAFESTNPTGDNSIHFTSGSANHDTGEIICNFAPSGSWQQAIIRITFDADQQTTASDTLLSITVQFTGGVQVWCAKISTLYNSAGSATYSGGYQKNANNSGDTITWTNWPATFRAIELVLSFEGLVSQAIIPAGGLTIANQVITGFHD